MTNEQIEDILKSLVEELFEGNFALIYKDDKNKKLSIIEIETAISEYPGQLTMPPETAFVNYYKYKTLLEDETLIEFNLWYDFSESDLTLSLTIYSSGEYSIEDIHVL